MSEPNHSVVFDYTTFLGTSSQKKWTFVDAFHFFSASDELEQNPDDSEQNELEVRLWTKALNVLSSRKSDEANLLALISIAKSEGIEELKLLMPYDLEPDQLTSIRKHSKDIVSDSEHDELFIML
ncbi:transporter [Vibrio viridaestus]|uniref:Transporter n=1 Tax=Vibrio viridaestus TaxID=2487322 RepID=A0A3N9TIM5_9VIBR|nr:transporter [Vibrio viridaestus]RQW63395.1 transporter [Vibrio viridaestus]